jgi:hypothetical protein
VTTNSLYLYFFKNFVLDFLVNFLFYLLKKLLFLHFLEAFVPYFLIYLLFQFFDKIFAYEFLFFPNFYFKLFLKKLYFLFGKIYLRCFLCFPYAMLRVSCGTMFV